MAKVKVDLLEDFDEIDDPRVDRTKLYSLEAILFIAIWAISSGAESWYAISLWGGHKLEWLRRFIAIESIPSHDTFARVFRLIDAVQFERCFVKWMNGLLEKLGAVKLLSIDGKTVRGSQEGATRAIHLVSAYASEIGLVLGQVKVDEKSNEITAIPELLELLSLKGVRVTIDAAGCQKDIARQIIQQQGNYCLAVKANQPTLYAAIHRLFEEIKSKEFKGVSVDYCETTNQGHGRSELREHLVISGPSYLRSVDWPCLSFIGRVEATRHSKGTFSNDARYYIGSGSITAEEFANTVRSHWAIENRLHWCLDVAFNEDRCLVRKDHAAHNFATLRKIVMNLLRQDNTQEAGLNTKRLIAASNDTYREKLLGLPTQI